MGIEFYDAHMKTLNKLYEMAKKHECIINFGMNDIHEEAFDWILFAEQNHIENDDVMQDLVDNLDTYRDTTYGASYWFELYDSNTGKRNIINYCDYVSYCNYEEPYKCSDEAVEILEEFSDYSHYLECRCATTNFYGWEGVDTSEAQVYRSGMLLKFFGDLVCDYLGEERIKEVY